MGYVIPMEKIEEKAKLLNVKILDRFSKDGHSYVKIHCLTHPDKPDRDVELYNFLNRDTTCGCMLRKYTLDGLKANPNVRQDLEIIGKYKNNSTPIECQCKICGYKWEVTPNKLTQGRGCPLCCSLKMSSGERYITKILQDNNIDFVSQKTFQNLKGKNNVCLRFDFYLPEYNLCIEFNGQQHYEPVVFNHNKSISKEEKLKQAQEKFKRSQENDEKKIQYCKQNSIELLIIPYYKKEDVEIIIKNKINQIKETVTTTGC